MTEKGPGDKLIMERLGLDPSAWARTEATTTCDFLVAVAGALSEAGQVSTRHVDALRIDLSAIQATVQSARQDPPILSLSKSGSEFIRLLESRYGRERLVLNLFRHGVTSWTQKICSVLNHWGHETLSNADKVLNRSILIYGANREPGDERLFSTLIVEMAHRIDVCVESIQEAHAKVASWHCEPCHGLESQTTEQLVAERAGMRGLCHETAPGLDEEYFVRRVSLELASLAQFTSHFTAQVTTNLDQPANVLLEMRSSWLQTESARLFTFTWPLGTGIVAMEVARNQVMMLLTSMLEALVDIERESLRLFPGRLAASLPVRDRQRAESLRGNLISDAMVAGLSAKEAEDSVIALLAYAEKHELAAAELIISELTKIHPALLPRTLERFQELTRHDPVNQSRSAEKSRGSAMSMQLLGRFTERAQKLPVIALMIAALLSGSGCGLKTSPKSEVDDLRPEIPFRTKP